MRRAGVALLIVSQMFVSVRADYQCRLYFENLTRHTSNSGAVVAAPGDEVAIHFTFTSVQKKRGINKWGTLQIVLPDAKQFGLSRWTDGITQAIGRSGDFVLKHMFQDTALFDNAIDPSGETKAPALRMRGDYVYLGVNGNRPKARNWDVVLVRWKVAGAPGKELHFGLEGRDSGDGLSTRIIDGRNNSVKITDNWLRVVSAP